MTEGGRVVSGRVSKNDGDPGMWVMGKSFK